MLPRKQAPEQMEQLYRVRVALRGVSAKEDKRIFCVPSGAIVQLIAGGAGGRWATIEWNRVQVRVFKQDLNERTESITTAQ
jgi:hypothetical protein